MSLDTQTIAALRHLDVRLAVDDQPVGDLPTMTTCREHKDKTRGNLAVYAQTGLHCFGCGFHIAVAVEALAYLLRCSVAEAVVAAPKYTNEAMDAYRDRATSEAALQPLPRALAAVYASVLWGSRNDRLSWLLARGLTHETIRLFKLGHDGHRFVIPVFDKDGALLTLRFRRDDFYGTDGPKYQGVRGRNGLYLYPSNMLDECYSGVVLCEGELDAIRLWQDGIPAASATNGAGQVKKLPAMLKAVMPNLARVVIATDQDDAGEEAARQTMDAAQQIGLEVCRLDWTGGKDVTEGLQLGTLNSRTISFLV